MIIHVHIKYQSGSDKRQCKSKKGDKDQESIQLSTTPDLGYQTGK